jgi:predicted nuclease of restriction endonuclease-like (RecB) superfamily
MVNMEKQENNPSTINDLQQLTAAIRDTTDYFLKQAQRQVNASLTLRNWIIGHYLVEYEQQGEDRAKYREKLLKELAKELRKTGSKGFSFQSLYLCRHFYLTYPQIVQTVSEQFQLPDFQKIGIFQTLSGKFQSPDFKEETIFGTLSRKLDKGPFTESRLLVERLSFSHFVELIKLSDPLKRAFYETQTIRNNWSVRQLQRAIMSMLFERTNSSTDKKAVLDSYQAGAEMKPEDLIRNPYLLEFLGLENQSYSETDLEKAIIDHLQTFLLEMGMGFCFEARQKRITFDNRHYRIDLVFYHRILKCHILVELKMETFSAADAGQMNVYLNYYKENEMQEGDNAPIGIILCAGKSEALVRYATTGLSHNVFVSKYLTNLPTESDLQKIIQEEKGKLL